MKKIVTIFLFASIVSFSFAQNASNYSISNFTNGSLVMDNNGNTINTSSANNLVNNRVSNQVSSLQSIGFDFVFMGKYYSHFMVSTSGTLGFGVSNSPTSILSGTATNDLTKTISYPPLTSLSAPILAPFWDRQTSAFTGATIRSVMVGSAPNRCRVVEWNTIINNSSSTAAPNGKYQVRIYESSGVIEYVYGKMSIGTSSTNVTASIGFTAGALDNQFVALENLTSFSFTTAAANEAASQNLVNTSTAGDITALNSTTDGNRRIFTFTPPALVGLPLNSLQIGGIGASCMSLGWTDTYSNESNYTIFISTDNVNYTYSGLVAASGNLFTAYNLSFGVTYYWKVFATTEGAVSNTITANAITACSFTGVYTIGSGGNFSSLTMANDSLRIKGIANNVVFELMGNYSSAAEVFPITFPKDAQLPCIASKKLFIRPAIGANNLSISGFNSSAILLLDSCSYVNIDGRYNSISANNQITISNSHPAPAIKFVNASNNKFQFLNIAGRFSSASIDTGLIHFAGTKANGCDNNKIYLCNIYSLTPTPTATKNILIYSSASNTITNDNDSILDCVVYDYSKYGIQLASGSNGWKLINNTFQNRTSIDYASSAAAIKINSARNTLPHIISNNYFGGRSAFASGNLMEIYYKESYYSIDVEASSEIIGNSFKRMKFVNTSNIINPTIRMINVKHDEFNNSYYNITNNSIGNSSMDSLHFTQSFAGNLNVAGIAMQGGGGSNIINNSLNNIKCYSIPGSITLNGILLNNSSPRIRNNIIGDPSFPSFVGASFFSIINNGNGNTYGIAVYNSLPKITDNIISRIYNNGNSNDLQNGNLYGIFASSFDSVSRNHITHLNNATADRSLYGIACSGSSNGNGANMISENKIHSLQSAFNVSGITGFNNYFIYRNLVHSLVSTSPSAYSLITGIRIIDMYSRVQNNMVRLGFDSLGNHLTSGNVNIIGVYGGHLMSHNSIYIGGNNVTSNFVGSSAYYFPGNALDPVCFNNIFYNGRSHQFVSSGPKHKCLDINFAYSCNYNLYYADGVGGVIGTFRGNTYTTMADWKAGTGVDINSISQNPNFINPTGNSNTGDLHLNTITPAEARGTNQQTSVVDFDGDIRANFSPIDLGADCGNFTQQALPVQLVSFTASPKGKDVHLYWKTLLEVNLSYFQVQRSVDGSTFNTISNVNGYNAPSDYHSTDISILSSLSPTIKYIYYRLLIVDKDGTTTYSNIIPIAINNIQSVVVQSVYPNPFKRNVTVSINLHQPELITFKLMDGAGRVVYTKNTFLNNGTSSVNIALGDFPLGIYHLKVINSRSEEVYKLIHE